MNNIIIINDRRLFWDQEPGKNVLVIQHSTVSGSHCNKIRKKNKGTQTIKEEIKFSSFVADKKILRNPCKHISEN